MSELEHQISQRSKIKLIFAMTLAVLLFGMIIPYNLIAEATHSALVIGMVFGCVPMFLIFVLVRRKMITKNPNIKDCKAKLFVWAFLFSAVFHTPILVINKIATTPFSIPTKIVRVEDSISQRMYIHPPHIIFKLQGNEHSLRIDRDRIDKYHINEKITVIGLMGSLGYIVEAQAN